MHRVLKRALALFLAGLIIVMLFNTAYAEEGESEPLELIGKNGNATVFISENAPETDSFAADVICDYLKRITGAEIKIKIGDYSEADSYIAIGSPDYTDLETPAENGYIIFSDRHGVKIASSGKKGAARGAYAFLEKYCGCHWYSYDCIVVPKKESISVPNDIYISYAPYFEYGECDTASARNSEFNVANGATGGVYCAVPDAMGGMISYLGSFCHTLTTQFCSADKYFDEHPEYFALHDGKRTDRQLCLTNPDTINIVMGEVMELLRNSYNPNAPLQIISLTQNDNQEYCECPSCKAVDDENGSHAGSNLKFANTIAAEVAKAGYDNVAIDTFAYQYTRTCPTSIKPLENVIVRLCSIECCFGHTIADEKCRQNVNFMADLKAWGSICNRLYVWDYVNNYRHTVSVFANFGVLQANVQTFYENGVKGLYEEGNYYIDRSDSEFGEMKTYLLTRLINDPYCDLETEIDGFLEAYYGAGWEAIKEFIAITTSRAATYRKHLGIYQNADDSLPGIKNSEIKRCSELWEKAKSADVSEEQRARIERSEISWKVWKCFNNKEEFSIFRSTHKRVKARDELYNDMRRMGIVQLGESNNGSSDLSDIEILHYVYAPSRWTKGNESRFIVNFNCLAVKIFKIMEALSFKK